MDSRKVFEQFKKSIDSIGYTDKKESMKVDSIITLDWQNLLVEPPKNSSYVTKRELEYLQSITSRKTEREKELIKLVDKESLELFIPILKERGLEVPYKLVAETWELVWPVIYNLKFKFNRPRPEQLAPLYQIKVDVTETTTHQTPAYPSGHTSYAALIAHILSDMYPKYRNLFFRQVGIAGFARCVQGVHYPSDNQAAIDATKYIWQNIKENRNKNADK